MSPLGIRHLSHSDIGVMCLNAEKRISHLFDNVECSCGVVGEFQEVITANQHVPTDTLIIEAFFTCKRCQKRVRAGGTEIGLHLHFNPLIQSCFKIQSYFKIMVQNAIDNLTFFVRLQAEIEEELKEKLKEELKEQPEKMNKERSVEL